MTFAGLPLHPLIVHVAVVLVPLAAVGLICTGWSRRWRQRYGAVLALVAVVGGCAAFLAAQSGESLQASIRTAARTSAVSANFRDHPGDGDRAEIVAIALAVVACAAWTAERWRDRLSLPSWATPAVYTVVALISVIAIVTIVSAGHSGATLVWKDLGTFTGQR